MRAADAPSAFVTITPVRVLDTRIPVGLDGPLNATVGRKLTVTGTVPIAVSATATATASPVPAGATGIVANVTVVEPTAIGFVSVRPGDATGIPTTSSLNITSPGMIIPNSVTVGLPTSGPNAGQIDLYYSGDGTGTTHLLVDIVGYYVAGAPGPQGPPGIAGPKGDTGAKGANGPAGSANRISDAQIALLRWHQDPGHPATITPTPPFSGSGLTFDGTNIWVTDQRSPGAVFKINPVTNTVAGGPFAPGVFPGGIAFDGTNIWVAYDDGKVARINPSTGAVVGSAITVGAGPKHIAFDGTRIWVANYSSGTVSRILAATGTSAGAAIELGASSGPYGVAFDGTYVWVSEFGDSTVTRINPTSGAIVGTPISVGGNPYGIAFDGRYMWVASSANDTISKIDTAATTPSVVDTVIAAEGAGDGPFEIAYDGSHIWVSNLNSADVRRFDPNAGAIVGAPIPLGGTAAGVVFDGRNVWTANGPSLIKMLAN